MKRPNQHCGRWVSADPMKHGARRILCTLEKYHGGRYHENRHNGWMWAVRRLWPALEPARARPPELVRRWVCRGWIGEQDGHCLRTYVATEAGARAHGWKIQAGPGGAGQRDQLCPQCGKPDPETLRLVRDLERSVAR